MAKVDMANLLLSLALNNENMKQYVYDTITRFSPTAVNVARILSHMSNTSIHITREDKELWDSSFERAKVYMNNKFKQMSTIELKKVPNLPTTNISSSIIYLVPSGQKDTYNQFVYSDGNWVPLGSTSVNMDNYYTKDQIDAIVETINSTAKHTHTNKNILDLTTASFTTHDKEVLQKLDETDLDSIAEHASDNKIHLSSNEQSALRSLITAGIDDIVNHIENSTIHLTPEEKLKYDNILQNVTDHVNKILEHILRIELVNELPPTNEAINNTIYLVPAETNATAQDVFDEWLFIGGGYEKFGRSSSSNGTPSIDISNLVTTSDLKKYVQENTHGHSNIDILNSTTAIFTQEILQGIRDDSNTFTGHIGNSDIHLSDKQIQLINAVSNLDNTVEASVRTAINNIYYGSDEDNSTPNPMTNFTKILFVNNLPTVYGDVNKQAIYLIPKKDFISSDNPFVQDSNITDVLKSTNYDKYIWSDKFNCWEQLDGLPIEFVDTLPTDKSNIKHGIIYFVPNGLETSQDDVVTDDTGETITTPIEVHGHYNKYMWNNITDSWEILYETPRLSDSDIDYILEQS